MYQKYFFTNPIIPAGYYYSYPYCPGYPGAEASLAPGYPPAAAFYPWPGTKCTSVASELYT